MFGFVQANIDSLKPEDKERYRAVYCGLCHALGQRHGQLSRFGLTYDMTFLALLLSSLYEPEETENTARCIPHPCKKHNFVQNKYVDYAADMTIALVYFKNIDDWNDEKNLTAKGFASVLHGSYKKVKEKYPRQCDIIEKELKNLSDIESRGEDSPDAAANCFGKLMAEIFVVEKDNWSRYLYSTGYNMGRFIYLADAATDLQEDIEKGSYNPFKNLSVQTDDLRPTLKLILGIASQNFEALPLVQDIDILRNIIYSGIWVKYNSFIEKQKEKNNNGQRTT